MFINFCKRTRYQFVTKLRFSRTKSVPKKTAGIIVIGDEILNGQVPDTNSRFLLHRLHNLGISVEKVSTIKDDINEIGDEVKNFSKRYTYVLTTGGIGPTHDDVTFEAIAKAFDDVLHPHPQLVSICSKFYKTTNINHPGMKLAKIPKSSKLTFPKDKKIFAYPCISLKNVYIFPGVPQLMQKLFDAIQLDVFDSENKFYMKFLYLKDREENLVEYLNAIVERYPKVKVGSYPEFFSTEYKVKITILSDSKEIVEEAFNEILILLPKDSIHFTE